MPLPIKNWQSYRILFIVSCLCVCSGGGGGCFCLFFHSILFHCNINTKDRISIGTPIKFNEFPFACHNDAIYTRKKCAYMMVKAIQCTRIVTYAVRIYSWTSFYKNSLKITTHQTDQTRAQISWCKQLNNDTHQQQQQQNKTESKKSNNIKIAASW